MATIGKIQKMVTSVYFNIGLRYAVFNLPKSIPRTAAENFPCMEKITISLKPSLKYSFVLERTEMKKNQFDFIRDANEKLEIKYKISHGAFNSRGDMEAAKSLDCGELVILKKDVEGYVVSDFILMPSESAGKDIYKDLIKNLSKELTHSRPFGSLYSPDKSNGIYLWSTHAYKRCWELQGMFKEIRGGIGFYMDTPQYIGFLEKHLPSINSSWILNLFIMYSKNFLV